MARAVWSGSVAFGLVNVPVGLFAATEDAAVHFNQFQEGTSDRIRYKRVNERTGREVGLDRIVRGHEVGDGDYVLLSDEEHGKQYLATIRAAEPDVLVLETMFFADEVRDAAIAKQLVESMTTGWDPANYRDTYRKRVEDLIKRKQRGEEIVTEGGDAPEDWNVSDLMDALRRSAEEMRGRGGSAARSGKSRG